MSFTATADDLTKALAAYHTHAQKTTVPAKHYRCRVTTWGTGPDLVMLNGLSDIPLSFAMLMERLSPHFRCITLELASGDDDDCRYRAYRHHHHIEDLVALFDALSLDRVHLFGSSFGATVSLLFAARQPSRVNSLVLQGGFPRRPLNLIELAMARVTKYWPGNMNDLAVRKYVMEKVDRPQFTMADPAIYDFFLQCSGETPIQCAARRGLMLNDLDLRPYLPAITQPTLLIGGDRDGLVPRWCEAELETGLPNVRRVEFSPCGHYPQYTHPNETAEEVKSFLKAI